MKTIDIIIVSVIGIWAIIAITYLIIEKKRGHHSCGGCCSSCKDCNVCKKMEKKDNANSRNK